MNGLVHRNNALKEKMLASNVLMGQGNDKSDTVEKRIMDLENSEGGGGGGSTVRVTPLLDEGVHVANIRVDGVNNKIYAPEGLTDVLVDGESVVTGDVARIDLSEKQDLLVAGANVSIHDNVISATDTTYSDFVGASSQYDGERGIVPKPMIADKDKFLKGDGTWGEVQMPTVPSDLDDLSDVAISSPTDGQILKYDSLNEKWVNGNGGGGGDVSDVLVDGVSVVTDGVAEITMPSDFTGATSQQAGANGLVPAPTVQDPNKFLKGDGTWGVPTDTTYSDFVGATAQQAGSHGLVPAPTVADKDKYLKGDGTWAEVGSGGGNLSDLNDVVILNPSDGDSLVYDQVNQKWENKEIIVKVKDVVQNSQSIVDENGIVDLSVLSVLRDDINTILRYLNIEFYVDENDDEYTDENGLKYSSM